MEGKIRQRLADLTSHTREAEIVEELAQHLEIVRYLLADGATKAVAFRTRLRN